MATNYPSNPRLRAYGKARIELAQRANQTGDWKHIWKAPQHPYPFRLGGAWKQCVEYLVDNFATEVGFMIDILGLEVTSLDHGYAQFSSPHGDFYFAFVQTPKGQASTLPDTLRIQFMVENIFATARELERRGIVFDVPPQPCQPGSRLNIGSFRTPHGIRIELWELLDEPEVPISADSEDDSVDQVDKTTELASSTSAKIACDPLGKVEELEDDDEEFFPMFDDEPAPPPAAISTLAPRKAIHTPARPVRQPAKRAPLKAQKPAPLDEDEYLQVEDDPATLDQDEDVEYIEDFDAA